MKHSSAKNFHERYKISPFLVGKLEEYAQLLLRWQKKVNLIGGSTVENIWERHFLDSIQVSDLIKPNRNCLVDLGSGAGFPGLVLALSFLETGGPKVHLVEANKHKASFLSAANKLLGTNVIVHDMRLQKITNPN